MATIYSYIDFANDILAFVDGNLTLTPDLCDKFRSKASALLNAQVKRAEYASAHPSKSKAKGASETTIARAAMIRSVLTDTPQTAAEIAALCDTEEPLTALQVSNAMKYIEGAKVSKVIRQVTTKKGLMAEREYSAYSF